MKILETDRLFLREFSNLDEQHLFNLNLDPDVIRYTGDKAFTTIEEAKLFFKKLRSLSKIWFWTLGSYPKIRFGIFRLVWLEIFPEINEVDIGFRFKKLYWNKGYATEAAKPSIEYGFQKFDLKSIVGRAMKENLSSIRVLEKIGLTFEKALDFDNNLGVIYKILKSNAKTENL